MPATLTIVILLLWGFTAARALFAVRRTPVLEPPEQPATLHRRVAVFVPVRDEIDMLPRLLISLQQQQDVNLDVVCYDDLSGDGSRELLERAAAKDPSIVVVHGAQDPPPGWCGKTHALVRATEAYAGEADLWLFLDADVQLEARAVSALVAELESHDVDLVSALPTLDCQGFWASVLGPNFASVATLPYPPARVNDPRSPTAFMNGQIALIRREAYLRAGGFAVVKAEVLEDVALAKRLKEGGARLRIVNGQALARTTMYVTFAEHLRGWSKNIFALLGYSKLRALFLASFLVTMSYLPLLGIPMALTSWWRGDYELAVFCALGYLVPTVLQISLRAVAHAAPLYAPFAPLAATVVSATVLRAAFTRRPLVWKGRSYTNPAAGKVGATLEAGHGPGLT